MKELNEIINKFSELDEESRIESILQFKKEPVTRDFLKLLKMGLSDQGWRVRKTALDVALSKKDNNKVKLLLIEGLRSHDNAGLRNTSTEGLIRIGEKMLDFLEKAVNDPDTDVRKIIIDVLGEIKSKKSLKIVSQFLKDRDENVRSAAAEAIGKIGDSRGIPILLNTLKGDDNYLKFTALEALGLLGEKFEIKDIDLIVGCLNNSLLGRAAYDALGRSKNIKAMKYLIKGLLDLRRSYRESALIGIVNLYNDLNKSEREILVNELKKSMNEHLKDELLKSLQSFTVKIKLSSAAVLSWLKVKEALPVMIELLKDESVSEKIEEHIAQFGSMIISDLIEIMRESDEFTVSALCKVIGRIGDTKAEDELIKLLSDDNESVRVAAAEALGRVGTVKAIKELFNLFNLQDHVIQNVVRNALRELSVKYKDEIKKYALTLISSQDENLRANSIYVLGFTGDRDVLELINLGLKDPIPEVRQMSAEALGMLKFTESLEPLSYALTDEDHRVRLSAIKSISSLKTPKIIDSLKIALRDEHVWVRVSAVKALSQLDTKTAAPFLDLALMDNAPPVVMAALDNYKEINIKSYINAISKVMMHKNPEVVKECMKILKELSRESSIKILKNAIEHPVPDIRLEIIKFFNLTFPQQMKKLQEKMLQNEKDEGIRTFILNLK
jgi:HEAT repeat protein